MTTKTNMDQAQPGSLDIDSYKNIIEDVLKESKAMGATSAEAGLSIGSGLSTTVRMRKVETIEHNRDKGLSVTLYFGNRKGSASTTDLSPQAYKDAVSAACRVAQGCDVARVLCLR